MVEPGSIQDLFDKSRKYHVPAYQRAYAWEQTPHLECFLSDLRDVPDGKAYYLGTFLLQEESTLETNNFKNVFIVDGQQRLTTIVIFMTAVLKRLTMPDATDCVAEKDIRLLRRRYLVDEEIAKFSTIDDDTAFFAVYIRKEKVDSPPFEPFETPSQRRLWQARKFFDEKLSAVSPKEVLRLVRIVEQARILAYSIKDPGEATQIFELHNDRGKGLTDLEALKGFLMHKLYLNARNPEHALEVIHGHFEKIYRTCEQLFDLERDLDEDSVLRYHCVAFVEGWNASEHSRPKDLVKNEVRRLVRAVNSDDDRGKVVEWIMDFTKQLQESFKIVLNLLIERDSLEELADLYVLGRMANFYPLLMKSYRLSRGRTDRFRKVTRLLEKFAFRGYGIGNLRADKGKTKLYDMAKAFSGDFDKLEKELREISGPIPWDVEQKFHNGLQNPLFYDEGRDARYLLWKYENWLRSQPGNHYAKISWRDYIDQDSKDKLSIEHIAAQKGDLSDGDYALAEKEGNSDDFRRLFLHCLGNLVLDCHSPNASKGKMPFPDKKGHYASAPLISQNELCEKFVVNKVEGRPIWDEAAIKRRTQTLVNFSKEFWDINKF